MKKRALSILLALSLCFGMLPPPVFAEVWTETSQPAAEVPTEAPAAETPTEAPASEPPTETPTEAAPIEPSAEAQLPAEPPAETQDPQVTAVQALIDALPAPEDMSVAALDALEQAYAAYEALTAEQQAQLTGLDRMEALFAWVNSQTTTLAGEQTLSGNVTWDNQTFTTGFELDGDTILTLTGTNKLQSNAALDLQGHTLTVQGDGSLEIIGTAGIDDYYITSETACGTFALNGGTVTVTGGMNAGKITVAGGELRVSAAVRTRALTVTGGTFYATGKSCAIFCYQGSKTRNISPNLTILYSAAANDTIDNMEEGTAEDTQKDGAVKTVYIGKTTPRPSVSVGSGQLGTLYEGLAGQTAAFAVSGKNVDMSTLAAAWAGDHPGLTESLSADRKTLTVTADADAKQGSYALTLSATGTDGTTATKTATVTVSGPPIAITGQPEDLTVDEADLAGAQTAVQVAAALADGLSGKIAYRWYLADGTPLDTGSDPTALSLSDLFTAGKLTQNAEKTWLLSAQAFCALTYGSYSVNTKTVTLAVNTCAHEKATRDGKCRQCGEPVKGDAVLVHEQGDYRSIYGTDVTAPEAMVGDFLSSGGTFYLVRNVWQGLDTSSSASADKDVILDFQGYTVLGLKLRNFPYSSLTLKNGSASDDITTEKRGKLILDGITFTTNATFPSALEVTVQGNTIFNGIATFQGTAHLRGGSFSKGINIETAEQAKAILEAGYAYQSLSGNTLIKLTEMAKDVPVTVVKCSHPDGMTEDGACPYCGFACAHIGVSDAGVCPTCGIAGFAATVTKDGVTIGFTDLKTALKQADGGTVKLLKDIIGTYEITSQLTLDLNGHSIGVIHFDTPFSLRDSGTATQGKIGTLSRTNEKLTFADVHLDAGYALYSASSVLKPAYIGWVDPSSQDRYAPSFCIENVTLRRIPVLSLTLTANKTAVTYGQADTVTLTAAYTPAEGVTAEVHWYEVKSKDAEPLSETGDTLTLPKNVNAGSHTYRVTVTAEGYEKSAQITVTVRKAANTITNNGYILDYTYTGNPISNPEMNDFLFTYVSEIFASGWEQDGEPVSQPTDAGTYQLWVSMSESENYERAYAVFTVTVSKASQAAEITVKNETIAGRRDGGVTLVPSVEAYELREKGETYFSSLTVSGETFLGLSVGIPYEIRRKGTENYLPSEIREVTVQPGRKLTVQLPENQSGCYTLTAEKTELNWHEPLKLTFALDAVGAYQGRNFAILANGTPLTGENGVYTLKNPEEDVVITVTDVKKDNTVPSVSIRGRHDERTDSDITWKGFEEAPENDYVNGTLLIEAKDRAGIARVWYCLSDKQLSLKDMDAVSWTEAVPGTKADCYPVSVTKDGEYYLYAKARDRANNISYACTGKLTKEENLPTFNKPDGYTYYVTSTLVISDDGMLDWYAEPSMAAYTYNLKNAETMTVPITGNHSATYTIEAADRCGNRASITVHIKPISALTKPADEIEPNEIQKTDAAILDEVEQALNALDLTHATEEEQAIIDGKLAYIQGLRQVLDQVTAVETQIGALPDSVEAYQQTLEDTKIIPARQAYEALTDHQKTLVDETKLAKLTALEDQLNRWTVTGGGGQIWYKGNGEPLRFTVNGQARKIVSVAVGEDIFTLLNNSVVEISGEPDAPVTVTISPAYLQARSPGEYRFAVIYGNGSGERTPEVDYAVAIPDNYLDVTGESEFDGKADVTIDGQQYPIEELSGERYVNLPDTGDLMVTYTYLEGAESASLSNYPTGMQVYRLNRQPGGAIAEPIPELENLLYYAGCSIRVSGQKGVRMITGLSQDKKTALTTGGLAGYTLVEYGTVVQWADSLGSNMLNLNGGRSNYAYKLGAADPVFAQTGGMVQYTNVLVGFSLEQCSKTLVMRPYLKLADADGNETVLYGGCVTRSIGYIAWQNRDTYPQGTGSYAYVQSIIEAVDTSAFPGQGG